MALSYSLILHFYDLCQPINSLSLPSLFTSKWGRWAGREPQAKRSHKVEAVSSGNASDAVLGCHAGRSGLVHFSLASLYVAKSPAEQSTACFPFQKSVFSSKRKTLSRILANYSRLSIKLLIPYSNQQEKIHLLQAEYSFTVGGFSCLEHRTKTNLYVDV